MIYEVWYKNGLDLDYFGNREAAEMWLEKYIAKLNARGAKIAPTAVPWTREDFEIREKEEPRPVVNPNREFPDPRPWW